MDRGIRYGPDLHEGALLLELSPRETEVVALLLRSKTVKEVCAELALAQGTVKQYVHRAYRKLGVSNRVELAEAAHAALTRQRDE